MADPRFFPLGGPFTLGQLAEIGKASLAPAADPAAIIVGVAPLDTAGPGDISFLDNRKYADAFGSSKAAACIVRQDMVDRVPRGMMLLITTDPYRTYARIAQAFHPVPAPEPWVAPTAWVDATASVGEGCRIEPGAAVMGRAEIGARCRIGANTVIGEGVILGDNCIIGANVTVSHAIIGARVNLYPGVRIGQDGFGFAMSAEGHLKVPQLGRVIIGDDVEVGANSTIDRGSGPDTVIGSGSMIDNLVQIGHNVRLGRGCVMVSQSGISGSTQLGDFVVVAGQAGITGHLRIGSGARVGAQAGVMRDIDPGQTVGGSPAVPMVEWLRQSALINKMVRRKG